MTYDIIQCSKSLIYGLNGKLKELQNALKRIKDVISKLQSDVDRFRNVTNKLLAGLPVYTEVIEINKNLEEFETLLDSISEITNIQILKFEINLTFVHYKFT